MAAINIPMPCTRQLVGEIAFRCLQHMIAMRDQVLLAIEPSTLPNSAKHQAWKKHKELMDSIHESVVSVCASTEISTICIVFGPNITCIREAYFIHMPSIVNTLNTESNINVYCNLLVRELIRHRSDV